MPHAEMAALLRLVLDEVCADIPSWDTTTRERVAARLSELVSSGCSSIEELKQAGRDALIRAPTMWP
jgi:hypothetical protein